jgi:ornithine decarboxylase
MEKENDVQRYSTEVKFTTHQLDELTLIDSPIRCCDDSNLFKVSSSLSLEEYNSDGETSVSADSSDLNVSSHSVESPIVPLSEGNIEDGLSTLLGVEIHDLKGTVSSIPEFIHNRIANGYENGSFLTTNLATVVSQLKQWRAELPMVEPFYAVKCNPDVAIVRLLAALGCSFDCATMGEVDLIVNGLGDNLSFGAKGKDKVGSSVVYANPAKMQHMLDFAITSGVKMTVIDGEDELMKIAETTGFEQLQVLLRLTTDDRASVCRFSKKFGCPVSEAPHLLDVAKELGINIAGVSFHVGSGCGDAGAYATALEHARVVFEEGAKRGMLPMTIVDIGGGFPGDNNGYGGPGMPSFHQLAETIRNSITKFIEDLGRPSSEIRFLAEPGRYFVSASTTITTKIYSRKGGKAKYQALYVDDGVYGSFNNVVYDHALPVPKRLISTVSGASVDEEMIPTAVFGPTCDGLDQMCSLETTVLPRCEVGEWLFWEEQGAYTHTASFVFNGYTHIPKKTYCYF